ncbi:ATP-binding protein [Streptomyces corynorhini]|uniref:ATP-binding protein n=1 Tax=Streptomyces corynorhini TaxID=2282652 RepID=A0A370AZG9_9ACTN|nr:ATP-binding protein [Streptomyces corynorhini]RDG34988.1 ATP-binding protein [Streptomyces corynorhini]
MPTTLSAEPLRATFRIPKRKKHVPAVRARVRETLVKWGLEQLAPDVELVASELITNAVIHCRVSFAEVQVTVHVDWGELVLEVSDPDRARLPQLGECRAEGDEEGGRGLLLVAALSDSWGCRELKYGKCVWARFRTVREPAEGST